jgi:hypothetical protein
MHNSKFTLPSMNKWFDRRTISRMNYATEIKILECKGTQYDKFGFWKLEYLKFSSSFFFKCILCSMLYLWLILNANEAQIGESMDPNSHPIHWVPSSNAFSVLCFGHYVKKILLFCSCTITIGFNKVWFGQCEGL